MVRYPIRVHVAPYRGSDQRKQVAYRGKLSDAARIEEYINSRMQDEWMHTFDYWTIADDLGIDKELVRELLSAVDAGSNGITVFNDANRPKDDSGPSPGPSR